MAWQGNNKPFNGNAWYLKTMHIRTRDALAARDARFERMHGDDRREQLLDFVRARAKELGCVPDLHEVTGAQMIIRRFGTWTAVLRAAGLPEQKRSCTLTQSERYKAEYARQQELYREEKRKKLELARLRQEQISKKKR